MYLNGRVAKIAPFFVLLGPVPVSNTTATEAQQGARREICSLQMEGETSGAQKLPRPFGLRLKFRHTSLHRLLRE